MYVCMYVCVCKSVSCEICMYQAGFHPSSSLNYYFPEMERALLLLHSQLGVGTTRALCWASSCSRVPDVKKSSSSLLTLRVRADSSTPAVATTATTTLRRSASDDDDDDDATTAFFGGPFEEGELPRPQWSGNEPLSRLVSALISIKPLFALMTAVARQVLIKYVPCMYCLLFVGMYVCYK